jgi:MFS family permease
MRSFRDLFSLILTLTILQLAGGALGVLLPLSLDAAGASPSAIGLVQACFAVGFMAGAVAATALIRRMGPIRAYSAAAAACAAITLALYLRIDPVVWGAMRAVQGFCIVLMFASAESWLAVAAPPGRRGSVLGVYHVSVKLSLLAGPFLIAGLAPLSAGPFMIAAAIFALSLIPLCATRQIEPAPPTMESFSIASLWRAAPAAVVAAFVVGMTNQGMTALLPVYAARLGDGAVAAAAALNAAMWAGGVLLQWPAGRLSDRLDRRLVIAGLAALSCIGSVALLLLGEMASLPVAIALIAIWGAGALSIYGVAVAHAADAAPGQTQRAIALMLLVWAAGAVIGPALAGVLMQALGPRGLFMGGTLASLALAAAMIARRRFRDPTLAQEKAKFEPAGTTSPAAAAVDPRAAPQNQT